MKVSMLLTQATEFVFGRYEAAYAYMNTYIHTYIHVYTHTYCRFPCYAPKQAEFVFGRFKHSSKPNEDLSYVSMHMCVYVCMLPYVSMHVCVNVCINVYMYVWIHAHTCIMV